MSEPTPGALDAARAGESTTTEPPQFQSRRAMRESLRAAAAASDIPAVPVPTSPVASDALAERFAPSLSNEAPTTGGIKTAVKWSTVPLATTTSPTPTAGGLFTRRSSRATARSVARATSKAVMTPAPRAKLPLAKAVVKQAMSVGAMLGVGALFVSTSMAGLTGVFAAQNAEAAQSATVAPASEVQSLGAVVAADVPELARDSYAAKAYVPPVVRPPSFAYLKGMAANPGGSIQWPLRVASAITLGFGSGAGCSYCSSFHRGVDFVPGAGTPIQSIAAGTVTQVVTSGSTLGNYVVISHNIDGQSVQSLYAHMAWGSIQVAVGQEVPVGTIIGAVGQTGAATGPHLHLEVHVNGTAIDPYAWLVAHAN